MVCDALCGLWQEHGSTLTWKFFSSTCSAFQLDVLVWTSQPPSVRALVFWLLQLQCCELLAGVSRAETAAVAVRAWTAWAQVWRAPQGGKVHNLVAKLNGGIVHVTTLKQSVRKQPGQVQATVPQDSPCRELHGYSFTVTVRRLPWQYVRGTTSCFAVCCSLH